jgi:hypothetical protein
MAIGIGADPFPPAAPKPAGRVRNPESFALADLI